MTICITNVWGFELPDAAVDILTEYAIFVLVIPLSCIACLVLAKSISACLYLPTTRKVVYMLT